MERHDVKYFRSLLEAEQNFLTKQCQVWQKTLLESNLPEDTCGEIRTAVGLTELLLNQKLKQFSGLIKDCELQLGEKQTTCDDLEGFWDMVSFEIEKVKKKFVCLEKLESNKWKTDMDEVVPLKRPKLEKVVKASQKSTVDKAHILAAKQRLAEAKAKAMKEKGMFNKENGNFLVIEVPKQERIKIGVTSTSKEKRYEDSKAKKQKQSIPLSCITRSAKRALAEQNKWTG